MFGAGLEPATDIRRVLIVANSSERRGLRLALRVGAYGFDELLSGPRGMRVGRDVDMEDASPTTAHCRWATVNVFSAPR